MNAIKKDGKYYNFNSIKMSMNVTKAKGIAKDYINKQNKTPCLS